MSIIIPTATATSSSSSSASSSYSYTSSSTIDTQTFNESASKQQLWHVIEKQRSLIYELQKALTDVTTERDDLLFRLSNNTNTTNNSSIITTTTTTTINNTTQHHHAPTPTPTPPPRSPYRSNSHNNETADNYTPKSKSIPATKSTLMKHVKSQNNLTINEQEQHDTIKIKVKSIHSSSFILSIVTQDDRELWRIEKTYPDLIHLDNTIKSNMKAPQEYCLTDLSDLSDKKQRKQIIESYFESILLIQCDIACVYSFITLDRKGQEGYLSKRGKHVVGGWKRYYFILFESELKYFSIHQGQICIDQIYLFPNTQIGKQSIDDLDQFRHAFIIINDSPTILSAESDTERDKWVQALLRVKKRRTLPNRSNSDTQILPVRTSSHLNHKSMYIEHHQQHLLHPKPLYAQQHRSSMDDQAILRYYESLHQPHQQPQQQPKPGMLLTKTSVESIPLDDPKKKHRKSFWSRRKFFNNSGSGNSSPISPVADTSRHTLSFPFVSTNDEGSSSSSSACSTPMFQVFGVPLEEAIRISRLSDNFELPAIVYRCIEYLEANNAVYEEGIYRLSGSSVQISHLRQQFCEYGDLDLLNKYKDLDVHVVAGLLKAWLRELPVNVLTNELLNDFLMISELDDKQMRIQQLGQLVSALPLSNYTLLRTLIAHLIHIVQNAEHNKMTLRNVGIVFAPTLSIPSGIFTLLMSEFEYVFWTKDEETHDSKRQLLEPDPSALLPENSTSADRIKYNYLKAQTNGRSNRNSHDYKNRVPLNIISLEDYIDSTDMQHKSFTNDMNEIDSL